MLGSRARLAESPVAELAPVALFAAVQRHVFGEVAATHVAVPAQVANVRPLASVRPHVFLETWKQHKDFNGFAQRTKYLHKAR